jgi:hypothetical protein
MFVLWLVAQTIQYAIHLPLHICDVCLGDYVKYQETSACAFILQIAGTACMPHLLPARLCRWCCLLLLHMKCPAKGCLTCETCLQYSSFRMLLCIDSFSGGQPGSAAAICAELVS